MGKKKTGAYMGGGMTKKKGSMYNKGGSMYNKGGMPMVMKAGKKVPAFAADGVGKMNMGGMAKKKKPMASTGYKEGGEVKKKETFGQAFKRNRNKFKSSGSAADYTFKHNGKSYNILQKGETKAGVMKKFSAPKTSVRPKLRSSAGISANTKKKIEETVKKVATPSATTSKDKGSSYEERQKQLRKDKATAAKRKRAEFKPDGTVKGPGQKARPGARPKPSQRIAVPDIYNGRNNKGVANERSESRRQQSQVKVGSKTSKASSIEDVKKGQAKFRDRAGPQRRARDVTYAEWKAMSRAKKEMLGLPVSVVGGELGFKRFRTGFTGKNYTAKTKP